MASSLSSSSAWPRPAAAVGPAQLCSPGKPFQVTSGSLSPLDVHPSALPLRGLSHLLPGVFLSWMHGPLPASQKYLEDKTHLGSSSEVPAGPHTKQALRSICSFLYSFIHSCYYDSFRTFMESLLYGRHSFCLCGASHLWGRQTTTEYMSVISALKGNKAG